jgi:hypothetical protein
MLSNYLSLEMFLEAKARALLRLEIDQNFNLRDLQSKGRYGQTLYSLLYYIKHLSTPDFMQLQSFQWHFSTLENW